MNAIVLLVVVVLAIIVLWLRIRLWLSEHDARLLRQVTVMPAPPPPGGGCLGSLLPLAVLGVLWLLAVVVRGI